MQRREKGLIFCLGVASLWIIYSSLLRSSSCPACPPCINRPTPNPAVSCPPCNPSSLPVASPAKLSLDDCKKIPHDELCPFLAKLIQERKQPDGTLAVTSITSGFIDFAENWLCTVRKLNFRNYILLANDKETFDHFTKLGEPVYPLYLSMSEAISGPTHDYNTLSYQKLMLLRTEFVAALLNHDVNVHIVDVDAVWNQNPYDHMNLTPQDELVFQNDATIPNTYVPCGGFLWLRSCPRIQQLFAEILRQHRAGLKNLEAKGQTTELQDFSEQYLLRQLLENHFLPDLKIRGLDPKYFPSGDAYFSKQIPQKAGVTPVVIHNNFVIGKPAKMKRFVEHKLWVLDPNGMCT
eukprot:gnl/Trimastix_PCT/2935.p1 GENE.gnl/Trimastix_PCT/2935~~gnl/Trimastix_PCT/2935.p1  ORF type:complete len:361 (+),score=54.32 gnl/Trimastix_PCT/2935:35-1084(+)